jgi:hypothetical protein
MYAFESSDFMKAFHIWGQSNDLTSLFCAEFCHFKYFSAKLLTFIQNSNVSCDHIFCIKQYFWSILTIYENM